jgi:hypothetical protein
LTWYKCKADFRYHYPQYRGRYQAHPVGYWRDEFRIAGELGLACIEFIVDYDQAEQNPLQREEDPAEIQKITAQTGVRVRTICVDYLMQAPLHSGDEAIAAQLWRSSRLLLLRFICHEYYHCGAGGLKFRCGEESGIAKCGVR